MKTITRTLFTLSLLLLFAANGRTQAPKLDWLATQQIAPNTNTWEIAQLRNNVYKAGSYSGILVLDPANSDTITSSNNGSGGSGFIVKYDTNGNYVKGVSLDAQADSYVIASSSGMSVTHLITHNNGNVISAGRLAGTAVINDTVRNIGTGHIEYRGFVICLDSNFNYLWGNSLGNLPRHVLGGVIPLDVSVNGSQSIYASFTINYPGNDSGFIYGSTPIGVINNGRDVILKINSNTGQLMSRYTEFNTGTFNKTCIDNNSNVYFVMGDNLYKRDSSFHFKWSKSLTTNNINFDEGSLRYYEGRLYLSCRVYGDFDGTPLLGKTYALAQVDTANGNIIWKKFLKEPIHRSHSLGKILIKNGQLVVTGTFRKTLYFGADSLVATGYNSHDIFIAKFDTAGNHLFSSTLNGPSSEYNYLSNEQGSNLYLSARVNTNTNFVVDGSTPVYVTTFFTTGFAQYNIFPSTVIPAPTVNLGNDTTICSGFSITLSSGLAPTYNHLWSTSDTSTSITVNTPGQYWVHIVDNSGTIIATDTIVISVENLSFTLGNDTTFNDSLILSTGYTAGSFYWNTASSNPTITVKTSGTYSVAYTSVNGCVYFDTITVTKNPTTTLIENPLTQISIYPVPTFDYLYIKGLDAQQNINYRIISQTGSEILSGELTGNSINVSELKPGMYCIILVKKGVSSTHNFVKL